MRTESSSFLQVPQCRQDLEPNGHRPVLPCNSCHFSSFLKASRLRPKFLFPVWERSQLSLLFFEMANRLSLPPAGLLARNDVRLAVISSESEAWLIRV